MHVEPKQIGRVIATVGSLALPALILAFGLMLHLTGMTAVKWIVRARFPEVRYITMENPPHCHAQPPASTTRGGKIEGRSRVQKQESGGRSSVFTDSFCGSGTRICDPADLLPIATRSNSKSASLGGPRRPRDSARFLTVMSQWRWRGRAS